MAVPLETAMAADPLLTVCKQISACVAEIRTSGRRLSAVDLHARMNAIQRLAADHGLDAMAGLARCSAQRALLPGHRIAMQSCLEHFDVALSSRTSADCTAILAVVATRLH
jgi:hypothetical protein